MKFNEHPLFEELVPREKKYITRVIEERPATKLGLDEFKEIINMNKFKHQDELVKLFTHTNDIGEIIGNSRSTGPKEPGSLKTSFKKNAYRRWKRKGMITITDGKETIILKGITYEVKIEGKIISLAAPGQQELNIGEKPKEEVKQEKKKHVKRKKPSAK